MRYLFTTILTREAEFAGRVGDELVERGHQVSFVSTSRHDVKALGERGFEAVCVLDTIAALPPADLEAEVARIEARYGLPTIRDVYRTDPPCDGKPEAWCLSRTAGYFRALELLIDRIAPDAIVPEVGRETIRTAAHLIGVDRRIPVLFLFHTIFPRPLRLYVDTMHAPIVAPEELRPLSTDEAAELEAFRRSFTAAAEPTRAHRRVSLDPRRMQGLAELVRSKAREDADNEYLRPASLVLQELSGLARANAARLLYDRRDSTRPYVYFPLHVTDDYKIMRLIPHCADQASLVEQVADALPPGYDLVLKEHPLSIGRNQLAFLRRLATAAERAPRRSPREHPPADRRFVGGCRDQLDGRPRGAPLRQAGPDARQAVLCRLRRHARSRFLRARSERPFRSCSASSPIPSGRAGSSTRRCAAATRALRSSSTTRMQTRAAWRPPSTRWAVRS